jgi:quercetin dioxygenase-like cupin family protein
MAHWNRFLESVLFATVLSVVAPPTVSAQDVVTAAPGTHKVIFENDHVRVLDFHAKPGETVAMHSHPASVVYYLTDAKLKITYPDGRTEERNVKAGTAFWADAVKHAVTNMGNHEFHGVHTELKDTTK